MLTTDEATSLRMRSMPKARTTPEQAVARHLCRKHVRYTRNNKDLPGSPDFANRSKRWAIFVNGCFWHHHTACPRATVPKRNTKFWQEKFRANRRRDASAIRSLRAKGFKVSVFWECMIESESFRLSGSNRPTLDLHEERP